MNLKQRMILEQEEFQVLRNKYSFENINRPKDQEDQEGQEQQEGQKYESKGQEKKIIKIKKNKDKSKEKVKQ